MVDAKKKVPVDLLDRSKLASTSHSFVPRSWDDRHQQHMQLRSSNQFIKRELMKQKTLERKSSRVNIHGQEVNATNLRVTEDHQTQRVRKKNESEHTTDGGPGMSTSKKLILSAKRGRCRNGPEKKRCERGIRKHGQKKEKQRKGRRKGHGNSQRQALSPPFRRTRLHLLKADPRNHKQRRKHTPNVIHPDRFTGESAASSYVAHKTAVLVNMLKDTHCRLGESISDRIKRELDTRKRKERLEQVSQYYGAAEDDSFSLQQQHVGKPHQPQGTCGSVSSAKEEEEENSTGNFADNKDEEGERCSNKEIIQQEIGTGKL